MCRQSARTDRPDHRDRDETASVHGVNAGQVVLAEHGDPHAVAAIEAVIRGKSRHARKGCGGVRRDGHGSGRRQRGRGVQRVVRRGQPGMALRMHSPRDVAASTTTRRVSKRLDCGILPILKM